MWERVIEPQIISIAQLMKKLHSADQRYDFRTRNLDEYKEVLYTNYKEARNDLKEKIFFTETNRQPDENRIDIYKIFPPTNPGHDSYPYGRIKALALNDIYGIDFDLLAYADMMYWIEDYNKTLLG